ncbi:hypothetical protein GCM10010052_19820 [Paenarthrobacter histidinolovorans]|nr:hypothetical protein GCM10010052_19820 [Paenarthrobacter histidinolovorans]
MGPGRVIEAHCEIKPDAGPTQVTAPSGASGTFFDDFKGRGIKFRSLGDGIATDPASEVGGAMDQRKHPPAFPRAGVSASGGM